MSHQAELLLASAQAVICEQDSFAISRALMLSIGPFYYQ